MIGRRVAVVLAGAGLALLAACSGDDGEGSVAATTAEPAATAPASTTPTTATTPASAAPGATATTATSAPAVEADAVLVVEGYQFSPLTVAPGSVVQLENRDAEPHTVSSLDGSIAFDPVTETFVAPSAPGTYDYVCGVHAFMEGSLTVS